MGACLLLRLKSLWSLRPAFRSRASLLAQPSPGMVDVGFFLLRPERDSEALARAPKEIEAAAEGSGSESDSEDDCIVIRRWF